MATLVRRALRSSLKRRALSTALRPPNAVSRDAWASCLDSAGVAAAAPYRTHEVFNQASPLTEYNAFECDPSLRLALDEHDAAWASDRVAALGACVGSSEWQEQARLANEHRPVLHTHDRLGRHVDVVEYHPSYHELQRLAIEEGVAGFAWEPENAERPGRQVARGALMYLMYQLEPGVCCPTTMTYAATPAIAAARAPVVAEAWLPLLSSRAYDPRDVPLTSKAGAVVGMSMTEKQGGSDVRANTTRATPVHSSRVGPGEQYTLVGHKWFTSAPMSDGFLTLANTDEGVSCLLVPRWLPDGTRNSGLRVMRLKDKLGDRSNASSEVEYSRAWGVMLGQPGRGVRTIVEMVVHTRLDCTIGSAALMRQCAQLAAAHAAARGAFGRRLEELPLMRSVLLDLAVETEAANALWPRLARSFELAPTSEHEAAFRRVATAVGKYSVCKRAPSVAYEAMECLGGNGYVEGGSPMARLYRQAPLNAIWEGSGNVIALDILRALHTEPRAASAFLTELRSVGGADGRLDALTAQLAETLQRSLDTLDAAARARMEARARLLVDRMGVALQAATLIKHGHPAVAEAFCASRLPAREGGSGGGWNFGALRDDFGSAATDQELLDRLMPH